MRTLIPTLVSTGFALAAATLCGCGRGEVPIRGRFVSVTNGAVPRHLVLEGTPTEMGRAAGRLLGPEIRAAAGRPLPIALLPSLEHYAEAMRPLASAAMLEELDAMAREAGVSAADLFLRESSRDGLRWHGSGGPPRAAAFASAPGDGPDVVVAFAGADLDPRGWIVVERHPVEGRRSLVLARAGEIGAIGGVAEGGGVVVGSEIEIEAERRTLRAQPFSWSIRAAIERRADAEAALSRVASSCGHRVLAADASNARRLGVRSLAAPAPRAFDARAWVLASSGSSDDDALARAVEHRLASYAARPGTAEAVKLSLAGRAPDARGPVARWGGGGLVLHLAVAADASIVPGTSHEYRWSAGGTDAGR